MVYNIKRYKDKEQTFTTYQFLYGLKGFYCISSGFANMKTKVFIFAQEIVVFSWTSKRMLSSYIWMNEIENH